MAVLGVTDHRWLDLPDGGLSRLDPADPVARLAEIVAEVDPDTILTFGPDGGTFHLDHQTVSAWTSAAWEQAGSPGQLLHAALTDDHLRSWGHLYEQWEVFMTEQRPRGVAAADLAVALELSGASLDQKITALYAMHTQTAPALALLGADHFRAINAHETFIDASRKAGASVEQPHSPIVGPDRFHHQGDHDDFIDR
jgi:LmbE family N-acetylglucosaminyl deacetylase